MLELDHFRTETNQKRRARISRRAESLASAQRQLIELCSSKGSRSSLEEFLATWRDPLQPDHLQANALAWFQAAEPLVVAISSGCEDVASILLAHGVKPERPDMWAPLDVLENTGSKTALELLFDNGWAIDQPLNENATSILG